MLRFRINILVKYERILICKHSHRFTLYYYYSKEMLIFHILRKLFINSESLIPGIRASNKSNQRGDD